jgi:hypothetical protein
MQATRLRTTAKRGSFLEGCPVKDGTGPLELIFDREALEEI